MSISKPTSHTSRQFAGNFNKSKFTKLIKLTKTLPSKKALAHRLLAKAFLFYHIIMIKFLIIYRQVF